MGLFALYRVKYADNQLQVILSEVRQESSVEYLCVLPMQLWLVREITDQLNAMGFELECDMLDNDDDEELRIFATHAVPAVAASSADAIRAVCFRHAISAEIVTCDGQGLRSKIRRRRRGDFCL